MWGVRMRVMILPTSTGQGHNSASAAVKDYLDARGAEAIISDVLNAGRQKSDFVSHLYDNAVEHVPKFFGALYGLAERISTGKHHSPIYFLNTLYTDSLYKMIMDLQPQVIVCPHMFSAHAVTRLIEKYRLAVPTVGIITDYTCSPFWEETRLNRYVVANEAVAEECVHKGMRRDSIFPLGIPVRGKFKEKIPKREARALFGIKKEPVVLIMGGSMGYGKIPALSAALAQRLPDAQIVAACGHNASVYEETKANGSVMALPYINNIDKLMDAADILLTKPGGLSTTEAMTKRIPLIITMPIPGGEERNSQYISQLGMAVSTAAVGESVEAACRLVSDPAAQRRMIECQERYCSVSAAEDTAELIIKLAEAGGNSYADVRHHDNG